MAEPSLALDADAARQAAVVSQAIARASRSLGVTQAQLAGVLGVDASHVSRVLRGTSTLSPGRPAVWERALLFLRVYRSLDGFWSGSDAASRHWLATDNRALNGAPITLIQSAEGLVRVVSYLDAMRARV